jgi:hypothetical protein
VGKQGPWVAFECFAPEEDRYHTANGNAAKHQDDLGAFSHEGCKLACPCGGYIGEDKTDEVVDDEPETEPEAEPELEPHSEGNLTCTWVPQSNCSQSFAYNGKNYTGCAAVDYPTPWCSYDSVHKGSWATCSRVCVRVVEPTVQPTSRPSITNGTESPCARHPEYENDAIGNLATLDMAGYKIAAAADSVINMKRFVCRTLEKMQCAAFDFPSLMTFVTYYRESVSIESYDHLVTELTILCENGHKWVRHQ